MSTIREPAKTSSLLRATLMARRSATRGFGRFGPSFVTKADPTTA